MRSFGQNKSGDLVALGDEISETGGTQAAEGRCASRCGERGKSRAGQRQLTSAADHVVHAQRETEGVQRRGDGRETAVEGGREAPGELCVEQEARAQCILRTEMHAEAAVVEFVAEIIGGTAVVFRTEQHFVARGPFHAQITVGGGARKLPEAVPFEVGAAGESATSEGIAQGQGHEEAAKACTGGVGAEEVARELLRTAHHSCAIAGNAHFAVHAAIGEVGAEREIDAPTGVIDRIGAKT